MGHSCETDYHMAYGAQDCKPSPIFFLFHLSSDLSSPVCQAQQSYQSHKSCWWEVHSVSSHLREGGIWSLWWLQLSDILSCHLKYPGTTLRLLLAILTQWFKDDLICPRVSLQLVCSHRAAWIPQCGQHLFCSEHPFFFTRLQLEARLELRYILSHLTNHGELVVKEKTILEIEVEINQQIGSFAAVLPNVRIGCQSHQRTISCFCSSSMCWVWCQIVVLFFSSNLLKVIQVFSFWRGQTVQKLGMLFNFTMGSCQEYIWRHRHRGRSREKKYLNQFRKCVNTIPSHLPFVIQDSPSPCPVGRLAEQAWRKPGRSEDRRWKLFPELKLAQPFRNIFLKID